MTPLDAEPTHAELRRDPKPEYDKENERLRAALSRIAACDWAQNPAAMTMRRIARDALGIPKAN